MGRTARVLIPYEPRDQFLPFHARSQRWAVIVAHRRAGKTVACINDLLKQALVCSKPEPRFAYIAPYYAQAKDVAWSYLKHYAAPIPGVQANESELRIDLPNGGRVRLYGAENYDRLRGIYLDGVVMDEPADIDPRAWAEVVRPALSDRQGWAAFIGTPKGRNAFWSIYDQATRDAAWYHLMLKASETGILPQSELDDARKSMSPDQYEQEYECSFQAAIQGAYYGQEMIQAEKDNRIGRVPHDPALRVETWWDLGIGDSTAIWFAQRTGPEVRIIDYYESSGVGLAHYAQMLDERAKERKYLYGRHVAPHDIEVKELGTGQSRNEVARSLGINFEVARKLPVDDGIQAVRSLLPRCWFDAEKCARGLEALRQYRREWDDKLQAFKARPLHDWTSHAADAARYGAVAGQAMDASKYPKPNLKWIV